MSSTPGSRHARQPAKPHAGLGSVVDHRIDLHGMTVEQATAAVARHLDRCLVASVPFVHIIHGHGSGALREAVHQFLDRHADVLRRTAAAGADGGTGVTVAELRAGTGPGQGLTAEDRDRLSRPRALRRR